jgi:hypothetical protein
MPSIFLSYSRTNSLVMEVVRDNLRKLGSTRRKKEC